MWQSIKPGEDFPVCRGIDFIEKSDKMTQKARNRNSTASIQFINRDFLQVSLTEVYGVIICPFFLDCFKEQNLELVISKLREHSKKGGILIVTEFQKPTSFIVRLMHVFFRIASRLESKKLKNIDQFVQNEGFTMEQEKFFHRNMIFSRVYRNL
ncbi:MAG: class I SAM-dependent methyltransferase [Bacteroidota bacterium]